MKHFEMGKNKVILATLLLSIAFGSCSKKAATQSAADGPIPPGQILGVRSKTSLIASLSQATGIAKTNSNVTNILTQVGTSLNYGGGPVPSGKLMQANMDIAAAFCNGALNDAAAQKFLFSNFHLGTPPKDANGNDTMTNDEKVAAATLLLTQFNGRKPTDPEVKAFVAALVSFFNATPETAVGNSATQKSNIALVSCVLAAVSGFGITTAF